MSQVVNQPGEQSKKKTAKVVVPPSVGKITFEAEGQEGGRFHSREPHVPSGSSGVTIGRGYDMSQKSAFRIKRDLMAAGVSKEDAEKLSGAHGKTGKSAKDFIAENDLKDFEISPKAQAKLFEISYDDEADEVKRISKKDDVVKKYGKLDWDKTSQPIKDLLIDLKFRGDYTGHTRTLIQKAAVTNDLKAIRKLMSDREKWQKVPLDRFKRRRDFIDAELKKLEGEKKPGIPMPLTQKPGLPAGKTPPKPLGPVVARSR
ncbi:MAG: hypothetical protein GY873_05530 [Bosea sp.]|uniref:pesticin C-terminus-like muramidase n=1 Tax=Bosea sp. (in: a-proteobacteria) TaxID=1871050 RepID=UPI0023A0237B|nr:hypothetical protein [Bosea sp. (in: a-proteobacteria)]MCP4733640.1 hypothetical protein [Bosea sp. (in: a-proteobacteria)]